MREAANRGGLLAVDKLPMNLAPERIDHGYLQVPVVSQAFVAEVLGKFFAVSDRFRICLELNADSVPHRNAVFHIEEKLLHGGGLTSLLLTKPQSRYFRLCAAEP